MVTTTRDELVRTLAAIERALERRVDIWIAITEPDGTVSERIYRGSFNAQRLSGIERKTRETRS